MSLAVYDRQRQASIARRLIDLVDLAVTIGLWKLLAASRKVRRFVRLADCSIIIASTRMRGPVHQDCRFQQSPVERSFVQGLEPVYH